MNVRPLPGYNKKFCSHLGAPAKICMHTSNNPLPQADRQAIQTFEPGDPNENPWVQGRPGPELIEVLAYAPTWSQTYGQLYRQIIKALKNRALAVEHIGSTAVPHLSAKPVIDIDLIVADPEDEASYIPALQALGYVLTVRERSWYGHRMLKLQNPRANLHVFGPASPEAVQFCLATTTVQQTS